MLSKDSKEKSTVSIVSNLVDELVVGTTSYVRHRYTP